VAFLIEKYTTESESSDVHLAILVKQYRYASTPTRHGTNEEFDRAHSSDLGVQNKQLLGIEKKRFIIQIS
jgi:hypothetical protein